MTTETMLDIAQTTEWLMAHGFNYNVRQVTRMFTNRNLPARRGPDGKKLFVPLSALERFVQPEGDPPRKTTKADRPRNLSRANHIERTEGFGKSGKH